MKAQKISVVVPAHNEEGNIADVADEILAVRKKTGWDIELVMVDDNSRDKTPRILDELAKKQKGIRVVHRKKGDNGLGAALIEGTNKATGDIIVWMMGDRSDNPKDMIGMVNKINKGYDLVFGSRFIKRGSVHNYPRLKLVSNRLFNNFLRLIFWIKERDITNAFKAFRRSVLKKIGPLTCKDFDITVELPLKARLEGFRMTESPVRWYGRVYGVSNLKLSRTARKYIWTSLKIWLRIMGKKIFGKSKKK